MSAMLKATAITLALGLALVAGAAWADAPATAVSLKLAAPTVTTLAKDTELSATLLRADATPIRGAVVHFYADASFAGVNGRVHLGQATTDAQGVATIHYSPRHNGNLTVYAEFTGDGRYQAAESAATLQVTGSPPLYQETAGIQVPGLNSWLLIAVLTVVWAILFSVAIFILSIARAGASAPAPR